jgi:hypothetical protein
MLIQMLEVPLFLTWTCVGCITIIKSMKMHLIIVICCYAGQLVMIPQAKCCMQTSANITGQS